MPVSDKFHTANQYNSTMYQHILIFLCQHFVGDQNVGRDRSSEQVEMSVLTLGACSIPAGVYRAPPLLPCRHS